MKKADEHPFATVSFLPLVLAGNQNCGKTTLFNQLTGSSQHVGNFPGVTVDHQGWYYPWEKEYSGDRPSGNLFPFPLYQRGDRNQKLYSGRASKGIINIVDASNIERNLYLTMQLMELGISQWCWP